ncbi:MAG: hypothetical protein EOS73_27315 [Mesorhizobium sp.]|nr:hypothetical protein EN749_10865 [Mesorhizobium sp. M7A.F.Ca.ET.027.02.1.1]RWC99541.1 MAG: hypothetical protein EOS73_27315 [Mesorhizobium sp.]RWO81064.1 MAG: hypothetical protein EOQ96_25905 [Mesorhizobium sp.]RWQ13359.1 MAG: hypothetical protein EOR93_32015 [Mesorhizobium sp.]
MLPAAPSPSLVALAPFSGNIHRFVILGRSKERSDAAQTLGSMPGLQGPAAVLNSAPLHSPAKVAAWIRGSTRPLRSRFARG